MMNNLSNKTCISFKSSLCSYCKLNPSQMQGNKNDNVYSDGLMEASNSILDINLHEENYSDFYVNRNTLSFIKNQSNLVVTSQLNNHEEELKSPDHELHNKLQENLNSNSHHVKHILLSQSNQDDFHLRMESSIIELSSHQDKINDPMQIISEHTKVSGKVYFDKGTQTTQIENVDCHSKLELLKMQVPINETTSQSNHNSGQLIIEASKIPALNYEEMTKLVVNRKQHLQNLIDSIYKTSCHLDNIKRALTRKSTSTNSAKLPPAISTKSIAYENHFDFPMRSLFHKLPITVKSFNRQTPSKHSSYISSMKSIRNRVSVALPKRLARLNNKKETIGDLFSAANKENQLIMPTIENENKQSPHRISQKTRTLKTK